MRVVFNGNKAVINLWGKQKINRSATYRLMRYVLQVSHNRETILHNVVTGEMVALNQEEQALLNQMPSSYSFEMNSLIGRHFLVPEDYDEHKQVVGLRSVFRKMRPTETQPIRMVTILPTTACNARCYYCFEHGIKTVTMTEKIADDVVKYIDSHCAGDRRVHITWFGGEPTVASERIDQICEGLRRVGIKYQCNMITNGYLFDEEMICQAVSNWCLKDVQITIDGTEEKYNRVKAFVNADSNPYNRVMRNIGLLLEKGVHVVIRMNFDVDNYTEFDSLLREAKEKFHNNPQLQVVAFPVMGECTHRGSGEHQVDAGWFEETIVELNDLSRNSGTKKIKTELPCLNFNGCSADNLSSIVIDPEGMLLRCLECVGHDQTIGNIYEGITDYELAFLWDQVSDIPECVECPLFPSCLKVEKCPDKDSCLFKRERIHEFELAIKHHLGLANKV